MDLRDKLLKAAEDPRRSYDRIAKVTKSALRSLLPREAQGDIVMFHIGRSGSEVLTDMLDQHPRVHWDGEVFASVMGGRSGPSDPIAYLARRTRRAGPLLYGCEIKPFHLDHIQLDLREFVRHLSRSGFSRYVVLERRNYLRKVVSSVIAHETGMFHRGASRKGVRHRVTLDVERVGIDRDERSLLEFLESYDRFFRSLRTLFEGERMLWMTYEEDIQSSPMKGYDKVCSFVDIDPMKDVEIRYAKTNPHPLDETLSNVAEVATALRGTEYEWMIP